MTQNRFRKRARLGTEAHGHGLVVRLRRPPVRPSLSSSCVGPPRKNLQVWVVQKPCLRAQTSPEVGVLLYHLNRRPTTRYGAVVVCITQVNVPIQSDSRVTASTSILRQA